MIFFFFSSRRRHTRLQGDWSSDVCSSDLDRQRALLPGPERYEYIGPRGAPVGRDRRRAAPDPGNRSPARHLRPDAGPLRTRPGPELEPAAGRHLRPPDDRRLVPRLSRRGSRLPAVRRRSARHPRLGRYDHLYRHGGRREPRKRLLPGDGGGRELPNGVSNLAVSVPATGLVRLAWPAVTRDMQGLETVVDHYQIHVGSKPLARSSLGPATLFRDNVRTLSVDLSPSGTLLYFSVIVVDDRGNLSPF